MGGDRTAFPTIEGKYVCVVSPGSFIKEANFVSPTCPLDFAVAASATGSFSEFFGPKNSCVALLLLCRTANRNPPLLNVFHLVYSLCVPTQVITPLLPSQSGCLPPCKSSSPPIHTSYWLMQPDGMHHSGSSFAQAGWKKMILLLSSSNRIVYRGQCEDASCPRHAQLSLSYEKN